MPDVQFRSDPDSNDSCQVTPTDTATNAASLLFNVDSIERGEGSVKGGVINTSVILPLGRVSK